MDNYEDFKYNISYYLSEFTGFFIKRYINFKNFFKWGWRLKGIRPWDSSYLYTVMYYQLDDMYKLFTECSKSNYFLCHVGIEKDLKRISICKEVCKRLSEDMYTCGTDNEYPPWLTHKRPQEDRFGFNKGEWFNNQNYYEQLISKKQNELDDTRLKEGKEILFKYLKVNSSKWWI